MPALLKDDMEAINRYFMEQATVKTAAAEQVKQEWMRWWDDNNRNASWRSLVPGSTWYTTEEFDHARNLKHKFDTANATNVAEKKAAADQKKTGLTSEEMRGETKRAGTAGDYLEAPEPFIPTSWKVAGVIGVTLITAGVFAKKLLNLTPYGHLAKFLP